LTKPLSSKIRAPSGLPRSSLIKLRYLDMILSSSHGASLTKRCNALTLPSFRASAMGSMDLRSSSPELPSHVVEEMLSGFASYKTFGELFVEASEFVNESCNIVSAQVKFRDSVEVFVTSWTREHGLPPPFRVCCVVWQALDGIANNKSISRVVGLVFSRPFDPTITPVYPPRFTKW